MEPQKQRCRAEAKPFSLLDSWSVRSVRFAVSHSNLRTQSLIHSYIHTYTHIYIYIYILILNSISTYPPIFLTYKPLAKSNKPLQAPIRVWSWGFGASGVWVLKLWGRRRRVSNCGFTVQGAYAILAFGLRASGFLSKTLYITMDTHC